MQNSFLIRIIDVRNLKVQISERSSQVHFYHASVSFFLILIIQLHILIPEIFHNFLPRILIIYNKYLISIAQLPNTTKDTSFLCRKHRNV